MKFRCLFGSLWVLLVALSACNTTKTDSSNKIVHHDTDDSRAAPLVIEADDKFMSLSQTTATPNPTSTTPTESVDGTEEAEDTDSDTIRTPMASDTESTFIEFDDLTGDHFWLARPFSSSNGIRTHVESAYPYGTTALGFQPHHGVDIPNNVGVTIRAAASGTVFYAGDDLNDIIFGPRENFYGNVIVIEHQFEVPDSDGALFKMYTLYGHLSQFFVRTGDEVSQFQEIGVVGQEGVAIGPHLHLEVRVTDDPYDYTATYNPNLWLQPPPLSGVLAGRVMLRSGEFLTDVEVEVTSQATSRVFRTLTYHYEDVNPDPWFYENFVIPDLLEGRYDVIVKYQGRIAYQTIVDILPEKTTVVNAFVD